MLPLLNLALILSTALAAPRETDTLGPDIGSLVVIRGHRKAASPGSADLTDSRIQRSDAQAADQAFRQIPGTHVFVNSRGEAVLTMRGAADRQVGVFQDGAPLALPWDQRIDLSMIPMAMMERIEVDRGAPTVLYGPWASGGVINLSSRRLRTPGAESRFSARTGALGLIAADAVHLFASDSLAITSGAGFFSRRGRALSDHGGVSDLPPFGLYQTSSQQRTNTDARSMWTAASVDRSHPDGSIAGLSLAIIEGEKGEAPSGMPGDKARSRK